MRRLLLCLSVIILPSSISLAQSLEDCQQAARQNYPLIRQYDLIEKSTALTIENFQKGWLPTGTPTRGCGGSSDGGIDVPGA